MKKKETPMFVIVSDELKRKFKALAAERGTTIKAMLEAVMEKEIESRQDA